MAVQLITSSGYLWSELSLFEEYKFYSDQALKIVRSVANSAREELQLLNATGPAIYETLGAVPELYETASRVLELAADGGAAPDSTGFASHGCCGIDGSVCPRS